MMVLTILWTVKFPQVSKVRMARAENDMTRLWAKAHTGSKIFLLSIHGNIGMMGAENSNRCMGIIRG